MRYSFSDSLKTTITFRLEAAGAGTRLTLDHTGFDLNSPMGKLAFEGMRGGWPSVLARLEGAAAALQ